MGDTENSVFNLLYFDELAQYKTWVHGIHPLSKLLVTIVYILAVVSFGKHDILKLLPFTFYPVLVISSGELPLMPLLKRIIPALPFVIGIGIFNPLFDRSVRAVIFLFPVSGGWISFASLAIKCMLTVVAALLLLATTGMGPIAQALGMLRVPKIFVLQLLLTYRYIVILAEEVQKVIQGYTLRAPGQKGVVLKVWGSLGGQLLFRTYDRGERLYQAMKLRGFKGEYITGSTGKLSLKDLTYLVCWVCFFAAARLYNLPALLGAVITGVIR